jgi:beta-phosphoglucomutase-like phosphatase (HAD superfamily)
MSLRFPCLITDHDDTVVTSTPSIHYPAHVETMRRIRPGIAPVDMETWFLKNFDPGIAEFLTDELGFSEDEVKAEYEIWRDFVRDRIPPFFPGMAETLADFREKGGKLVVVSHSEAETIERDYRSAALSSGRDGLLPDLVFGWDFDPGKRKPNPYPVRAALERLGLGPESALVLDDLKPGIEMGIAAGVKTAGAGWGHDIGAVRAWMSSRCDFYFGSVGQFAEFLLG